MAWTQEDLDRIEAALASGAREVEYADKRIVRYTLDELLKLRDLIKTELAQPANAPRIKQTLGDYHSGHYPYNPFKR